MAEQEPEDGFVVAVAREDGRWRCSALSQSALADLDTTLTELRQLSGAGALFGLIALDDDCFLVVRPMPGRVKLLLSDATAALDYDIAADVLDLLRIETPDPDDSIWPVGDMAILADLGMPEPEMNVIVEDTELYPDEQLQIIAQRCGFEQEFTALLDSIQA